MIYLDYNATAPLRPEVAALMRELMSKPLNASSVHGYGREARKIVEKARSQVAALSVHPEPTVIFNSGATEGNNTVLKHFAGERILASAIEHPAVLDAAPETERIPVTPDGVVDLNALEEMLKSERTALVSIMMVNNETGVIQPVKEAAALAHKHGALFHCDAVQAAGRIPLNMQENGIDFLTLSAHKLGGPQGVGALIIGFCGETPALLHGGGQEKKARAGTENVAGIAGFGLAAEMAAAPPDLNTLQTVLEEKLSETDGLVIHGQNAPRVSNTTLFSLPGARSESLLMNFDLEGAALSNGSACTSGSVQPSHVLQAMNCLPAQTASAIRISTGWNTTRDDIDRVLEIWSKITERMKTKL